MDIVWSRMLSASGYRDGVYSVCVLGGRVYAAGFDELMGAGRKRYRIEALDTASGAPLAAWADESSYPSASLFTCTGLGDRVYAFGATDRFWSILVFDRDLNLVKRVDIDTPYLAPFSAIVSDRYIYVAGTALTSTSLSALYVMKISADDLTVVKSFTTDVKGSGAGAYAVVYNKQAKQVVIGGFDRSEGAMGWLVAYLSEDLELIRVSRPGVRGSITGLAVDPSGFVYATGKSRVVKLDKEGSTVYSVGSPQGLKIYASQDLASPLGLNIALAGDNEVYVLTSDTLSVVDFVRLSKGPQVLTSFIGSMDADRDNIYLAVTQVVTKDDWNWAVYALRPRGRRFIPRLFRR